MKENEYNYKRQLQKTINMFDYVMVP